MTYLVEFDIVHESLLPVGYIAGSPIPINATIHYKYRLIQADDIVEAKEIADKYYLKLSQNTWSGWRLFALEISEPIMLKPKRRTGKWWIWPILILILFLLIRLFLFPPNG